MKPHEKGILKEIGKMLASPLSQLVANAATEDLAKLFEAYWCCLLGKGAGAGWALNTEINAAKSVIHTSHPVIFDVGANNGEWSLLLHKMFPESRIFLFEPQPACQKIIMEKQIPNSKLIPNAVSSKRGTVQLYTTDETSVIASLHQRYESYLQSRTFYSIDVETITLDSVIEDNGLSCVDFIKMDIEGHELDALKGVTKSLEKGIIKALSFEFGCGNINSRTFFRDFWNFLFPMNYRIYRILPSSRLMPIESYYEDCEYFLSVTNYIAVLDEIT
ncbi:MAG: FkbM family methyltransferase [Okeania sp. SIO3I5]|uniref:FkbM family methyltransferase n=1 Tax=Okeania sp. SIO3I5 TaxID=2607805 RepID=UPI0013BCCB37|nr:FkbM family methyltransferase [Okeania sp. SIO3I5]NEQ39984.1 FkbM family methyltransferase [Okeania sp. SIO3I5]